jgi:hypothetical protein
MESSPRLVRGPIEQPQRDAGACSVGGGNHDVAHGLREQRVRLAAANTLAGAWADCVETVRNLTA